MRLVTCQISHVKIQAYKALKLHYFIIIRNDADVQIEIESRDQQ